MCRSWLVNLGEQKYWYASVSHHLAIDGLGYIHLTNKIAEYYNAHPSNKNESYGADWQVVSEKDQKYVNSQLYIRDKAYWRTHCSLVGDNLLHPYYRNQYHQ